MSNPFGSSSSPYGASFGAQSSNQPQQVFGGTSALGSPFGSSTGTTLGSPGNPTLGSGSAAFGAPAGSNAFGSGSSTFGSNVSSKGFGAGSTNTGFGVSSGGFGGGITGTGFQSGAGGFGGVSAFGTSTSNTGFGTGNAGSGSGGFGGAFSGSAPSGGFGQGSSGLSSSGGFGAAFSGSTTAGGFGSGSVGSISSGSSNPPAYGKSVGFGSTTQTGGSFGTTLSTSSSGFGTAGGFGPPIGGTSSFGTGTTFGATNNQSIKSRQMSSSGSAVNSLNSQPTPAFFGQGNVFSSSTARNSATNPVSASAKDEFGTSSSSVFGNSTTTGFPAFGGVPGAGNAPFGGMSSAPSGIFSGGPTKESGSFGTSTQSTSSQFKSSAPGDEVGQKFGAKGPSSSGLFGKSSQMFGKPESSNTSNVGGASRMSGQAGFGQDELSQGSEDKGTGEIVGLVPPASKFILRTFVPKAIQSTASNDSCETSTSKSKKTLFHEEAQSGPRPGASQVLFGKAIAGTQNRVWKRTTDREEVRKIKRKSSDGTEEENQAKRTTLTRRPSVAEDRDRVALICKNVLPRFNNSQKLRQHFSKFGEVARVFPKPEKGTATIHFKTHESALEAKRRGAVIMNGEKRMELFWSSYSPAGKVHPRKSSAEDATGQTAGPVKRQAKDTTRLNQHKWRRSEVDDELASMSGTGDLSQQQQEVRVQPSQSTERGARHSSPVPSTSGSSAAVATKVDQGSIITLKNSTARNNSEKLQILNLRDKVNRHGSKKQADLATAKAFVGSCTDMCPEKERYDREEKRRLHNYEILQGTEGTGNPQVNHSLAVKEYSRSSADQEEPLPYELRTLPTLTLTMTYLLSEIADRGEDGKWGDWFDFLWNRTRGIRKEITQQQFCNTESTALLEKCVRFHIFCAERLCEEDMHSFDDKINNENMTKCLQTLKENYSDLEKKQEFCPNEAEMRCYMVLMNLNQGDILRETQQLRPDVRNTTYINYALQVYAALNSNNFVRFFRLVRGGSFLCACILLRYFTQVRKKALQILIKAYRKGVQLPLDDLVRTLGFDDQNEAAQFCQFFGLTTMDNCVTLDRAAFIDPEENWCPRRSALIEQKRNTSVGEAINGGPLPVFSPPKPENSFDENGRFIGQVIIKDSDLVDSPRKEPKSIRPEADQAPVSTERVVTPQPPAERKPKVTFSLEKRQHFRESANYVKEGKTYEPDISTTDINPSDIEVLPGKRDFTGNENIVIFDLETTGLSRNSDIIQLAAFDGKEELNLYISPSQEITKKASEITGLKYDFESGCMFSGGQEVECIDIRLALLKFIDYISKREKPILVGHNVLSFDIPILSKKLQEHNLLQEFLRHVGDCLDTLRLARKLFSKETVGNYKQQTLVQVLLGKSYQAHDALADVKNLYEVFVSKFTYKKTDAFPFNYHMLQKSFVPLVERKPISSANSRKLANSGLELGHLGLAYQRDNQEVKEEAKLLFWEVIDGLCQEIGQEVKRDVIDPLMDFSVSVYNSITTDVVTKFVLEFADAVKVLQKQQKAEREAQARNAAAVQITSEIIKEVLNEETLNSATEEFREVQAELKRQRIERCSAEVAMAILNTTVLDMTHSLSEEFYQKDVVERLQRLADQEHCVKVKRAGRFFQIWKAQHSVRIKFKRSMLDFPSSNAMLDPAQQVEALIPDGRREEIQEEGFYVNQTTKLSLESPLEYVKRLEAEEKVLTAHEIYRNLCRQKAWKPLDVGSLVGHQLLLQNKQAIKRDPNYGNMFWKLVISLPDPDLIQTQHQGQGLQQLTKWLKAKFHRGPPTSQQHSSVQNELLSLYKVPVSLNSLSGSLGVCVRLLEGNIAISDIPGSLKGASGLIFVLPPAISEDPEWSLWEDEKRRLEGLLRSKPISPSLPLVVICPVPANENVDENFVQRCLNIDDLVAEKMISDMSLYVIEYDEDLPEGVEVNDPEVTEKLSDRVRWLTEQFPGTPDLQTLYCRSVVEDFLQEQFYRRVLYNLKQRKLHGYLHQDPNTMISLYNAAIVHLQQVLTSPKLSDHSWPVSEFTHSRKHDLPPLYWNTDRHLTMVSDLLADLQLPSFTYSEEEKDDWLTVCQDVWAYVQRIVNGLLPSNSVDFMSKIRVLLHRTRQDFEDTCDLCTGVSRCDPTYINMPWTDLIMACVEFKITEADFMDPDSETGMEELVLAYDKEALLTFEPPSEWRYLENDQDREETVSLETTFQRAAARKSSKKESISNNRRKNSSVKLKEKLSSLDPLPKTVHDATRTSTLLSTTIEEEKIKSKHFEKYLESLVNSSDLNQTNIPDISNLPPWSVFKYEEEESEVSQNSIQESFCEAEASVWSYGPYNLDKTLGQPRISEQFVQLEEDLKTQRRASDVFELQLQRWMQEGV